MLKSYQIFSLICPLMLTSTISAISFWNFEPLEVRDLINQKILNIEAEKPDVLFYMTLK
jgi:hypothetical protein